MNSVRSARCIQCVSDYDPRTGHDSVAGCKSLVADSVNFNFKAHRPHGDLRHIFVMFGKPLAIERTVSGIETHLEVILEI